MNTSIVDPQTTRSRSFLFLLWIFSGLLAFTALFLLIDQTYIRFLSPLFPPVGTSVWLATTWGIVSRAPWVVVIVTLAILKPGLLGLQAGEMWSRWRLVLSIIALNCAIVGGFLLITGDGTPYSGNQWLFTEIVTVPLVEELFWRGLVFSLLLALFQKGLSRNLSLTLAVWLSGIVFGLLHASNVLAGVPFEYVAVQTLNAVIWGVVYGYLRAKTGSVWPSVLAHAAMNLIVVLF